MQTKWWLKYCPVCRGDLYISYEIEGTVLCCLQCSREYPLPDREPEREPVGRN